MAKLKLAAISTFFLGFFSFIYIYDDDRKIVHFSHLESGAGFMIQSKLGKKGSFVFHGADESVSYSFRFTKFRIDLKKLKKGVYYKGGRIYIHGKSKTYVCRASEEEWGNVLKATENWSSRNKVYRITKP